MKVSSFWLFQCLTAIDLSDVTVMRLSSFKKVKETTERKIRCRVLPCSILPMSNWIHFLLWWLQIQTFSLFLIDNPQKLWEYLQYDHSQYVIYCSILLSFCSWTLDSGTIYQSTPLDQEVSLNSYRSILIQTEAVTFLMTHDSSFVLRWIL